jgi:scaffold Nfu/NifU family protein
VQGRSLLGQPVEVTVKDSLDPHVRFFETNRWLTGMGRGLYHQAADAPDGSMARMILDKDGVTAVHVYGSVITVTKDPDAKWAGLEEEIKSDLESFYIFYREGAAP